MSDWYDDDDVLAEAVQARRSRANPPVPTIPGCEHLEEIGRGGQGVVYRAVQTATRRQVAVKVLLDAPGRTRAAAIAWGVVAVLAVLVFAVTSWLWRRAVRESDRALKESRRAEASLDFFLDSIGMVDPSREGANTRLTDALDRVSAELDKRFGDEDLAVRMKFRKRLRDLYVKLGRFDRGLAEAEAVSAMLRAANPVAGSEDFRGLWNNETTRALALYRLHRGAESLDLYREAHDALAASFGERDRDALQSLASMAQVLKSLNRMPEAEVALRGVVRATEGATTAEGGAIARAMALDNLSAIAEIQGRPVEAEAPEREAIALFTAVKGEDALETLIPRSNLGNLLLTLDRPQEAVDVFRPTVATLRERAGAKSPMTLAASHNLGVALLRSGKADEGEKILKDVYETRSSLSGPSAHDTLLTLNELAVAAGARGDVKENERLLRLLVEGRKAIQETPPISYWNAINNLAAVMCEAGRPAEARVLYEQLLPAARNGLEPDHWLYSWFEANYGRCLTDLGQTEEAAKRLEAADQVLTRRLGASHENTLAVRKFLARNARARAEGSGEDSKPASRPLEALRQRGADVSVDRGDPVPVIDVDFREQVTDDLLGLLRHVVDLRAVRVLKGGATDRALADMGPQPRLELLVLVGSPLVTDAGLATIAGFASLRKLDVMSDRITAAGLERLAELRNLRELYLYGTKLTDADLAPLERFGSLVVLGLPSTVTSKGAARLRAALPNTMVRVID